MVRVFGKWLWLVLVSLSLVATACSSNSGSLSPEAAVDPDAEYNLGVGDQLRVTVFGQEDLSGEFEVDSGGRITMPLVGDLRVVDSTVNDVEAMIVDVLSPDYLQNPVVSVEVLTYRDFFIIGEVANPGPYAYVGKMTVITAVAMAGGFTYRAVEDEFIISRDGQQFAGRKDSPVLPGDVIEVQERFF
jgi:polysaccharide export outer membrane protein